MATVDPRVIPQGGINSIPNSGGITGGGGLDNIVGGLLGSDAFNFGLGLLQASGPSTTPVSFGQALGQARQFAGTRQEQQLRNQILRDSLAQQERQREQRANQKDAITRLTGLLTPTTSEETLVDPSPLGQASDPADLTRTVQEPARFNTPEGQREAIGILGDIAPDQVAQGLLGQLFAEPETPRVSTDLNTFAALNPGLEQGTPEFREGFLEFARENNANDNTLETIQTQLMLMNLQDRRKEIEQEAQTQAQENQLNQRSAEKMVRDVGKLKGNLEQVQGTFLDVGLPAPDLRRTTSAALNSALSSAGIDRTRQEQTVEEFDNLRKGFNDLIIEATARFGDNMTNQQLSLLQNAMANPSISAGASASILANTLETALDTAGIQGTSPGNEEQGRELIAELRRFGQQGAQPEPEPEPEPLNPQGSGRVIDFNQLPEG